jgi:hypothetical protein
MEEKILLPAAQRATGGEPLPAAAHLRLDHGALAAPLVPTPTSAILSQRSILARYNALEEGPGSPGGRGERLRQTIARHSPCNRDRPCRRYPGQLSLDVAWPEAMD